MLYSRLNARPCGYGILTVLGPAERNLCIWRRWIRSERSGRRRYPMSTKLQYPQRLQKWDSRSFRAEPSYSTTACVHCPFLSRCTNNNLFKPVLSVNALHYVWSWQCSMLEHEPKDVARTIALPVSAMLRRMISAQRARYGRIQHGR
jgi:hypothetical protein